MALTAEQKAKLVKILRVMPYQLNDQFDWLGTRFTAELQESVEDEMDRWESGIGSNFVSIKAMEANLGAQINPSEARNDIRKNIALILERPDWGSGGSRLQRS